MDFRKNQNPVVTILCCITTFTKKEKKRKKIKSITNLLINHRGLVKQKFFFPKTRSMQYVLSNSSGLLFLTKQFKKKKVLRVHFNYLSSLLNKDQLSNFTVQKSFHLILITLTRPKIQFDDFNFRKCKCNKSSFCIQIEFYIILRE